MVLADPEALSGRLALLPPQGPFLLGVQHHPFLLAFLAVLANLVFQIRALLVDQEIQVGLQVQAVQSLEVQEDPWVPLVLVAQQGLALLGEFPQARLGLSDLRNGQTRNEIR